MVIQTYLVVSYSPVSGVFEGGDMYEGRCRGIASVQSVGLASEVFPPERISQWWGMIVTFVV